MDWNPVWADAISNNESGGRYDLLGPVTNSGDRAYGKYQVMGNNIGPWTADALGKSMTPQEFLADPAAQDAVFQHRFGGYVDKYGSPQDAASAWFSGRPLSKAGNSSDILGTTVPAYVAKFNAYLGNPSSPSQTAQASPASGLNAIPQQPAPIMPQQASAPDSGGGFQVPQFAQIPQAPLQPIFYPQRKPINLAALRAALARNS